MLPIDPSPIDSDSVRPPLPWQIGRAISVGPNNLHPSVSLKETMEMRRSQRSLVRTTCKEIARTLALVNQVHFTKIDDRLLRTKRSNISAGAIHPVETFFVHGRTRKRIFYFEPFTCSIAVVPCRDELELKRLWTKATDILPSAVSTLLVFVGRPQLIESAYTNIESLLWRDAGALMQTVSMAAYGLGLGFCPVGMLGGELLSSISVQNETLTAVGAGWLGSIE